MDSEFHKTKEIYWRAEPLSASEREVWYAALGSVTKIVAHEEGGL
jgi:hypothetical protein